MQASDYPPELRPMSDVTRILSQINDGDPSAAEQLLPLVYEELRKLAAAKMSQEKPGQTLQATALVHEAYIRLVDTNDARRWDSRAHFFAAAAEAMRRVLIEMARRKASQRMSGNLARSELDDCEICAPLFDDDILAVDEALDKLAAADKQAADLVKLRYFAGFSVAETAELLKISPRKANQVWAYARVWLLDQILGNCGSP
jgi:RNA polymerase sigma factor (TIGR02999 family)